VNRTARRFALVAATIAGALSLGSTSLRAQDTDPLAKLDPQNRFAVEVLLDSARQAQIPAHPLLSKAYEGISKHADQRRIVGAVRSLLHALIDARAALGSNLTETEWSAAASALQAGVSPSQLARFRTDKPGKPLARALVVLADLVTRGVPVDTASSAIVQLWQRGAGDADLFGLWRDVEQDILSGANPGSALQQRAREFPVRPAGSLAQPPRQPETPSSQ
jgi:hypothetical protein